MISPRPGLPRLPPGREQLTPVPRCVRSSVSRRCTAISGAINWSAHCGHRGINPFARESVLLTARLRNLRAAAHFLQPLLGRLAPVLAGPRTRGHDRNPPRRERARSQRTSRRTDRQRTSPCDSVATIFPSSDASCISRPYVPATPGASKKTTAGMAHENVGVALLETGRADEAIAHFENPRPSSRLRRRRKESR